MDIVGYTYNADTYCVECTEKEYPTFEGTDCEGNSIHPIFDSYEFGTPPSCGDCFTYIENVVYLMCWTCENDPYECTCSECPEPDCVNEGTA